MTFTLVNRPRPTRTTGTWTRSKPFFDDLAEAIRTNPEQWIVLTPEQVAGPNLHRKQSRIRQEMNLRGLRINTVSESGNLLVTYRAEVQREQL